MSEYPGIRRATISYFADSITATAGLLVVMGVCCAPVLWVLYHVGGAPAGYALFAYLGLCVCLGQRDLDGGLRTVSEITDSRFVAWLLGVAVVLYYNAVVAVAAALAGSLSSVALGDWALAVALLYPFYDAEMADRTVPLSVAGGLVTTFVLVAWLAEKLAPVLGIEADETIDLVRKLGSMRGLPQDYLLEAYDRHRNRGATH